MRERSSSQGGHKGEGQQPSAAIHFHVRSPCRPVAQRAARAFATWSASIAGAALPQELRM
jgi:hypothetical protein